jgi:hypothetical protein
MATISATKQARIAAPAERVYGILSDYTQHHPRILPSNFSEFTVEQGGVGAGTVMRFRVKAGGMSRVLHGVASEPQPGRLLSETYDDGSVTSFTVEPDGSATIVRIDTVYERGGVRGAFERLFVPMLLRRMYRDELGRLDRYARTQSAPATQPAT